MRLAMSSNLKSLRAIMVLINKPLAMGNLLLDRMLSVRISKELSLVSKA